mmetsp:Transcript_5548/g.15066  ORF Transcript_5548/g.15066 Transcript_5548/m.15066 type:complete len:86 (-) Transcript_5548:38-295(-)
MLWGARVVAAMIAAPTQRTRRSCHHIRGNGRATMQLGTPTSILMLRAMVVTSNSTSSIALRTGISAYVERQRRSNDGNIPLLYCG